jgi:hypothetical protein
VPPEEESIAEAVSKFEVRHQQNIDPVGLEALEEFE